MYKAIAYRAHLAQPKRKEHFQQSKLYSEKLQKKENEKSALVQFGSKAYKFNKKYFINIWAILFLLTVFLNLYLLQPISWGNFQSIFKSDYSSNKSFIAVLVFGFLFFFLNDIFLAKLSYSGRIKLPESKNKNISSFEWLKLHAITFFIRSITPFSIGSEPYIIWWLKKQGVPFRQGSAIVSSLTISWFLAQGVITWPSFIYLHTQSNWKPQPTELKYYWMIVIGLVVDAISTVFIFTISYCKRVHYFFAITKNKLYQFLNWSNPMSKDELKRKYLDNTSFKREFKRTFFDINTCRAIIVFTFQNILNYSLFALLTVVTKTGTSFLSNFHIINISTTSNNFVPTPGSEGSIQFTIDKMNSLLGFNSQANGGNTQSTKTKEVIFLWRWFQKYQPLILSSIFLFCYFFRKIFRIKPKKSFLEMNTYSRSASWYTANGFLAQLQ